ncbi:MAG: ABC transporter permease [Planctomycetes bacterium]|nr:ABC transporter permease [Planctomycetota bacterium]
MNELTASRPAIWLMIRPIAGPLLGLLLVLALFWFLEPDAFLSARNLRTVSVQTVIVGLGAIGMTFVIASGGIDLSIGSVIALSSVVAAAVAKAGYDPMLCAMAGVVTGATCGLINGLVIARLGVIPFIATLGMMGVARGVAKWLASEQKIDAPAGWLESIMSKAEEFRILGLPQAVWLTVLLAVVFGLVLRHTVLGAHTLAIGSNEDTARLCGVRVGRTKVWIYVLCGIFGGLAGVMTFGRLTVGDPTTAIGEELDVIAAVVIGGASLAGGEGRIAGSILGALLMAFLANGCNLTGVPNYVQEILIGVIIVAAVAVDRYRYHSMKM